MQLKTINERQYLVFESNEQEARDRFEIALSKEAALSQLLSSLLDLAAKSEAERVGAWRDIKTIIEEKTGLDLSATSISYNWIFGGVEIPEISQLQDKE